MNKTTFGYIKMSQGDANCGKPLQGRPAAAEDWNHASANLDYNMSGEAKTGLPLWILSP